MSGDRDDEIDATELFTFGGAVLLAANNGSWYYVGLISHDGEVTLHIDQTPSSNPGAQYLPYIRFNIGGSGYKFKLIVVDGEVIEDVDEAVSGTTIDTIALQSTDLLWYDLYLDSFQGSNVWKVNQTPNP